MELTKHSKYLTDGEFYTIWKYANAYRLAGAERFTFDDINSIEPSIDTSAEILTSFLQDFSLEIEGLTFDTKAYTLQIGMLGISSIKLVNKEDARTALENIFNNSFTFEDFKKGNFYLTGCFMLHYFEFSKVLSKKTSTALGNYINSYLKKLTNDELEITNKNFLKFNKQKEKVFSVLKSNEEKYGKQFILDCSHVTFTLNEIPLIHAIASLEWQDFFTIQEIWTEENKDFGSSTINYKVRLLLKEKFYDETVIKRPKSNTEFDSKTSILKFQGKNIKISKTRNSDPHYLLMILMSKSEDIWDFDELWKNEYLNSTNDKYDPKTNWQKFYQASYSLNKIIASATTIKDFIVCNKTSITVNKKYLFF